MSNPPISYPLDLTGKSPTNLVVGEPHSLMAEGNRAFVPLHGPFFTRSLVVRRRSTGTELVAGEDYVAAQLHLRLTLRSGQEVCSIIVIRDASIGSDFEIDYQTVGGEESANVYAIEQMIAALDLDERSVRWGSIVGKPEGFPPLPHLHDIGDTYGWEYIVAQLEAVRQAILVGDESAREELRQLILYYFGIANADIEQLDLRLSGHVEDINNPHNTTKAHVGLGNVQDYPVATNQQAIDGNNNVSYMTPLRTREAIMELSKEAMADHLNDFSNPHRVTKDQVGLGNVGNYAVAGLAQAQAGEANNLYMTPLRTAQAVAALVGDDLSDHLSNLSNPHQVTKAQVGLGNVQNYPIATQALSVGGTDDQSYMTPLRTAQAITALALEPLDAHLNDAANPHNVTKAQVGLGNVENYGTATQAQAQAGTAGNVYMTALRVSEAIAAQVGNAFNAHTANTSNPHQVTKSQVGLGSVENYGVASQTQAESGTANNLYMTPLRTAQAITNRLTDINAHVASRSNPHGVTKAQVGLGSVENYGVASQAQAQAGTAGNVYMTPQRTAQAIQVLATNPLTTLINARVGTDTAGRVASLQFGTSSSTLLDRSGTTFRINVNSTSTFQFQSNGNLNVPGRVIAANGFQPSDRRLKKEVEYVDARALWRGINFAQFRMRSDDSVGRGVVAQELMAEYEDLVHEYQLDRPDGTTESRLAVNYTNAAFEMAIRAGQEIDRLWEQIAELKDQLAQRGE